MPNSLKKIIDLVKKTGDNCIVLDSDGSPAYVIVDFDDYQKIILGKSEVAGLTEDELLEKINRDIATWKVTQEEQNEQNLADFDALDSVIDGFKKPVEDKNLLNKAENEQEVENAENPDEKYYFEPID